MCVERVLLCVRGACTVTISIEQQHSSSSTTPAVFQALAFVPVVTVCIRAVEAHSKG